VITLGFINIVESKRLLEKLLENATVERNIYDILGGKAILWCGITVVSCTEPTGITICRTVQKY
jgi:hypothetical protein